MRVNLPVTSHEYTFPSSDMLVSITDRQGVITHCNEAFVRASGFEMSELIGQSHNLVRHPDMPAEAFKDLWSTIGRGRPWTAVVKNRRKDGDHYWVLANVTPILENGKPRGYMSVRTKPTPAQIQQAQALYAALNQQAHGERRRVRLVAGLAEPTGLRGVAVRFWRAGVTARLSMGVTLMTLIAMAPHLLGWSNAGKPGVQFGALLAGAAVLLTWFERRINSNIRAAERFVTEMAACNLTTELPHDRYDPLGTLPDRLRQIQVNLRAVITDVREEIDGFTSAAADIERGSQDLSSRTEAQASSLQQTSATMDTLSSALRGAAESIRQVAQHSSHSTGVAQQGGTAIDEVVHVMQAIAKESSKMSDITAAIENIAFRTNMLALNAAVEAARAGEQGRGFAVVAAEVRGLAQRSAEAVQDIRRLIGSSSERIGHGVRHMDHAAATIREAVDAVRHVGTLVDQITQTSQDQAEGIAQVNEAVTHLDVMTQHNAALAEESAAAAMMLNQRTDMLRRSVGVFVA